MITRSHSLAERLGTPDPLIFDGGLSTALEAQGLRLDGDLWTADVVLNRPDAIASAHKAFADAGAEVAITSSYQVDFERLASRGVTTEQTDTLLHDSVRLARNAASGSWVLASIGPFAASLADGSEYTGVGPLSADAIGHRHIPKARALIDAGPDALLFETIPSRTEALGAVCAVEALRDLPSEAIPVIVSFTCSSGARLRSGEQLGDVASEVIQRLRGDNSRHPLIGLGINCTDPSDVLAALTSLRAITTIPIVVYPNLGQVWNAASRTWDGAATEIASNADLQSWLECGISGIGGCCGSGPDHIAALASRIRSPR